MLIAPILDRIDENHQVVCKLRATASRRRKNGVPSAPALGMLGWKNGVPSRALLACWGEKVKYQLAAAAAQIGILP